MSNRKLAILLLSVLVVMIGIGYAVAIMTSTVKPIKVGVIAGPHEDILKVVQNVAEKDGLQIQVVKFNDYVKINEALAGEKLDANIFQPEAYLTTVTKDRGFKLQAAAKTVLFPLGFYSKKISNLNDLPRGAIVALPQDPISLSRALLLLHKSGVIALRQDALATPTLEDIQTNPLGLVFKTAMANTLPRHMEDAHILGIPSGYAFSYGLAPNKALLMEPASSVYAHVIAVREGETDNRSLQLLIKAYHSPEVRNYIEEHFQGTILPAW